MRPFNISDTKRNLVQMHLLLLGNGGFRLTEESNNESSEN